ncbi:MAG: hypothetical protein F6J97_15335 [Leptolyngbya sp. SIO4C1]|nr:hypothetical protein [Leptolyngbya sp. SIO4C1]
MSIVLALIIVGWLAASMIGTQAYFRGEQTKPIHERNWRSDTFEQVAQSVTGQTTDFNERVPAYEYDAYASQTLAQ